MSVVGAVLAHGSRSTVYEFGPDAVVKVPLPSTPDEWMRAEQRYTELVRRVGAPVARTRGTIDHASRPATVYEHIDGPALTAALVDGANGRSVGNELARIHLGLFDLVPVAAMPRQQDRLGAKLARVLAALPAAAEVRAFVPDPAALVLCHGDLHPGNVIRGRSGPVVIDWFDASIGDAVCDVARTCLLLGAGGAISDCRHLPGVASATLAAVHDAYLAAMRAELGFETSVFERYLGINALARIAEGVEATELLALARRVLNR